MKISSIDVTTNGKTERIEVTSETHTPINEPFSFETEDIELQKSFVPSGQRRMWYKTFLGNYMNYAGLDDFRVVQFLPDGPNLPHLYFVCNASDGNFYYNPAFDDITTPVFFVDGTIQSSWRAGAGNWAINEYMLIEGSPVLQQTESWEVLNDAQATHKTEKILITPVVVVR